MNPKNASSCLSACILGFCLDGVPPRCKLSDRGDYFRTITTRPAAVIVGAVISVRNTPPASPEHYGGIPPGFLQTVPPQSRDLMSQGFR